MSQCRLIHGNIRCFNDQTITQIHFILLFILLSTDSHYLIALDFPVSSDLSFRSVYLTNKICNVPWLAFFTLSRLSSTIYFLFSCLIFCHLILLLFFEFIYFQYFLSIFNFYCFCATNFFVNDTKSHQIANAFFHCLLQFIAFQFVYLS